MPLFDDETARRKRARKNSLAPNVQARTAKPQPAKPQPAKPQAPKPSTPKPQASKPHALKPQAAKAPALAPPASKPAQKSKLSPAPAATTPAKPPKPAFPQGDDDIRRAPKAYAIEMVLVATFHRLDEPTVDHCLFKALLVALGLHPTEGFFFKEGPVTPEEQARALAALALVYHPAVEPGMTEAEFRAVLLENDLIDPL